MTKRPKGNRFLKNVQHLRAGGEMEFKNSWFFRPGKIEMPFPSFTGRFEGIGCRMVDTGQKTRIAGRPDSAADLHGNPGISSAPIVQSLNALRIA